MKRTLSLAFLVLALAPGVARASGVTSSLFADDPAAAQALFADAKKLMAAGKYDDACPKLAESQRLAPAMGTKFNLADCDEHVGKLASAWAGFLSVAAAAKNASQAAREKAARDRAAAIEPKLSRLAIVVPDAAKANGLEVKRDGESVGEAEWGEAMPIDPGEHVVTATAPGKRAWKTAVDVEGNASKTKVIVQALDDEPAPVATPIAAPAASNGPQVAPSIDARTSSASSSSSKTIGWVLVGAGGASIVGGAVFWAMRGSVESRLDAECGPDQAHCPATATDDIANGKTYTAVGVGLFGLGAVGLVSGAIVLLTSGKSASSSSSASTTHFAIAPSFDPRAPGFSAVGAF